MSGGQDIKVVGGGLDALIGDMVKGVADLRGKVDDMERDLKPHMAEWEAGAKGAFEDVKRKWGTEVNEAAVRAHPEFWALMAAARPMSWRVAGSS